MATQEITRRLFLSASTALALPGLHLQAQAPGAGGPAANVEKDVVYGRGGGVDLRLDIYRPSGAASRRMAIIHYHGGGFGGGNKESLATQSLALSARGYVNIAAQYRLSGVAKWPAQMEDVKASIRWTRANAQRLGIDPARIAVAGYSAGGHLALFAAGTQNRPEFEGGSGTPGVTTDVAACLGYYAVTGSGWDGFRRIFPMPEGSSEEAWRSVSTTVYVDRFPPTVLFHGMADETLPAESSVAFLRLLHEAKVPSELHTFAGAPHVFATIPELAESTAVLADLFIDRHVINPRSYLRPTTGRGGDAARDGRP